MRKITISLLIIFAFTSMGNGSVSGVVDTPVDYNQKMVDVVSQIEVNTKTLKAKVESLEATKNNLNERINKLRSENIQGVVRSEKDDGSVNITLFIKSDSSLKTN